MNNQGPFETDGPQPLETNFTEDRGGSQHWETERDSIVLEPHLRQDSTAPYTHEKPFKTAADTQLETTETLKCTGSEQEYPQQHITNVFQYSQLQYGGAPVGVGEFIEADFIQQEQQMQSPKKVKSPKKDFICENSSKIKTFREIQLANSEKRKMRTSEVANRNSRNLWGYKFFGITEADRDGIGFNQMYRSQDWSKVIINNTLVEKKMKRFSDAKNQVTVTKQETNSQAAPFSSTKKELAYQKTNQSAINMLQSFKTLDNLDKGEELRLIPEAQGNVNLAQNLNRKSQLDQQSYGRQLVIPDEYLAFQPKADIIHNKANEQVMTGRSRHFYQSYVL